MTFGSLFAGIGGFDLGLERAGMKCLWQVEVDDFCTKVLKKHWPDVKRYKNVREVGKENLETIDLICGGFPCQQTSTISAIKSCRKGLNGKDSSLWFEYLRIVQELRPFWVIVENPLGILRWSDTITIGLERLGYGVSRFQRSAWSVGAPHLRRRVFFIANPMRQRCEKGARIGESFPYVGLYPWVTPPRGNWDKATPRNNRMDDGIPNRVDRLKCLGNAVVPQIVEILGKAIIEANYSIGR